jgi:hypothetical protein
MKGLDVPVPFLYEEHRSIYLKVSENNELRLLAMPWKPGQSGNPRGRAIEKPFRDALRLEEKELAAGNVIQHPEGSLRWNAQQLLRRGDSVSITQIADRLDGKPAQESTMTIEHKRNATDWTRAELVAFLNDACAGGERVAETDGSDRGPDSFH